MYNKLTYFPPLTSAPYAWLSLDYVSSRPFAINCKELVITSL